MLDTSDPDAIERFAQAGSCVLVTISEAKGSTPRIEGTMMLVSKTAVLGTIGGGQLEYMAIDAAREMIAADAKTPRTLSVPLGPEIGQCCGGHVTLLLAGIDEKTIKDVTLSVRSDKERQSSVYIFGAGHVGRALAEAMMPLPVNAMLIDSRKDELSLAHPSIVQDLTPLPEAHIRNAAPGSAFVILTHDHALDFLLASEALDRGDASYVGMIGSKTKRATFASWLDKEKGRRESLERLTMPIGASRLSDKRPAVIAAMVAAEVMETVGVWHAEGQMVPA